MVHTFQLISELEISGMKSGTTLPNLPMEKKNVNY